MNAYAKYEPITQTLKVRDSVYDGAFNDNTRDRFTIAHEIGHAILHTNVTQSYARFNQKPKAFEDPEWQANEFAANLLLPLNDISSTDNAYHLSNKYNVSIDVANIQLSKKIKCQPYKLTFYIYY